MGWKFGLIFLILIVGSLEIVSAQEVNLAASANGATITEINGNGVITGSIDNIIDETSNYYQRRVQAGPGSSAIADSYTTVYIKFTGVTNLNEINYSWSQYAQGYGSTEASITDVDIFINQSGSLVKVSDNTANEWAVPGPPWADVTGIQAYFRRYLYTKDMAYGVEASADTYIRVIEIRAFGEPEPFCGNGICDVGEDCSSCSADCGKCPCLSLNDTIMKLSQPTGALGALWDYEPSIVSGIFGNNNIETGSSSMNDRIGGGIYTAPDDGEIADISIYLPASSFGWDAGEKIKCAVYDENRNFIASTEERNEGGNGWQTFNFASSVPIIGGKDYSLVCWADNTIAWGESNTNGQTINYFQSLTYGNWPASLDAPLSNYERSIYANYNIIGESYDYEICYSEIFGGAYGGPNFHYCDNNKILGLFQHNESYAEIPGLYNYNYDVCYGNLSCHSINTSAGESCAVDEKVVVSLERESGSLIANASESSYPIKICCKPAVFIPPTLGQAYWADMTGASITEADVTDRVKMIFPASGFADGTQFRFEIYEDDPLFDDDIRTEAMGNAIYAIYHAGDSVVEATWQITQQDIINGEDEDISNFFFRVYDSGELINESGILEVSKNKSHNTPPNATILSPGICDIYFIGEGISFTQDSYDIDDNITIEWDFGDGSTSDSYDVIYSYTETGQKTITLTVTDERGLIAKDRASVLIVDPNINGEEYICGHVNKPEWGKNIRGFEVAFDASQETYAIEASGCDGSICDTINCIAGTCKDRADINLIGSPNPTGFENIVFSWVFDEVDLISGNNIKYSASGMAGAKFNMSFSFPGDHWAKLNVSINPSGSTGIEFSTSFFGICREIMELGEITWYWWDNEGNRHEPLTEEGSCVGMNGVPDGISKTDDCCPPGYICESGGLPQDALCLPGEGFCIEQNIVSCSDYTDAENCSNWGQCPINFYGGCGGTIEINETECGSATGGGTYITETGNSCRCEWNETESECRQKTDIWPTITSTTQLKHTCDTEVQHGECVDGLMNVNVQGSMIWDSSLDPAQIADLQANCDLSVLCASYEGPSICGKSLVKLPFFTSGNLIATICIILLVYSTILIKKISKYL